MDSYTRTHQCLPTNKDLHTSMLCRYWISLFIYKFTCFHTVLELFWHLDCVLMLNWFARNRTVLISKLCTNAKMNYLKWNCLTFNSVYYPVGWGCRIHWLHLCKWVSCYDAKQSHGEVTVMLGLWGIRSTPSLPLLPGPLCPSVVAPDRSQSMG